MRSVVNFHQIWRTPTASLTFSLPLAKILVCWSSKLEEHYTDVYSVRTFLFWSEKRLVERLKQIEIVPSQQDFSGEMEGENTMEKRLRMFRAHSRIFLCWSEVIELLKSFRAGIIDET